MKLDVSKLFSVQEVMDVLDVYECSAIELLDGTIEWEAPELVLLAKSKGLSLADLFQIPQKTA